VATLEEKLRNWTTWLFQAAGGTTANAGNDTDGSYHQNNQPFAPNYWMLAGTWNDMPATTRRITVPDNTPLFVVVASSHASDPGEIDKGKPETLDSYVDTVDGLFDRGAVAITRNGQLEKTKVVKTPRPFDVTFPTSNEYYAQYLQNANEPKKQSVLTKARVCEIDSTGTDSIVFFASRPSAPNLGKRHGNEVEYHISMKYIITHAPRP
jgi:hypothetical protein